MILDLDERINLNSIYGINDCEKIKIIPGVRKSFYGAKHLEDFQNLDNCVKGTLYSIDKNSEFPYVLNTLKEKILIEPCRYIVPAWERKENMTVREFIEANFENLIGYTVKIEDYDEYEHFSVKIDFKTNLDNIKDDLSQQLLDDTLVDMFDYSDEEDIYGKLIILQSRCEL